MRPDEHKKRKNTSYKKKHGIQSEKGPTTASAPTEKPFKSKSKTGKDIKRTESNEAALGKSVSKINQQSFDQSSGTDSDTDKELMERKSFRRREVVSNWRKYDMEPDLDGPVTTRGEDFEKLLNMAGEAMSRFRFKDEIEWEDDLNCAEGTNVEMDPDGSDLLSLDLADLSSSMACIPIHRLLNIDERLFPTDQLAHNIKSANENRHFYDKSKKEHTESSRNTQQITSQFLNQLRSTDKPLVKDSSVQPRETIELTKDNKQEITKCRSTESKTLLKSSVTQQFSERSSNTLLPKKSDNTNTLPQTQTIVLEDDALDQLLEIDATDKTVEDKDNSKSSQAKPSGKKDDTKEAEELEDWLDSILD